MRKRMVKKIVVSMIMCGLAIVGSALDVNASSVINIDMATECDTSVEDGFIDEGSRDMIFESTDESDSVEADYVSVQDVIEWLYANNGASYNVDGAYGAQCADFSSAYMNWVVTGNPYARRYGINHARNFNYIAETDPDNWEIIWNTPEFVPNPGDIFVSAGYYAEYGHTGVVISSDVNYAKVIDQNAINSNLDYGSPAAIHDICWTGSYAPRYFIRYRHFEEVQQTPRGAMMDRGYSRIIPDGVYQIVSAVDSDMNMCLDVPGNDYDESDGVQAHLWNVFGNEYDVFTLRYEQNEWDSTGFYTIQHAGSTKCLDVNGADTIRSAKVQYWEGNGTAAQKWAVSSAGDGFYYIQSKCSGYYLDVEGGKSENGTIVQLWDGNGTNAQKWAFIPYAPSIGERIFAGDYQIVSANDYCKSIGVDEAGNYPNALIRSNEHDNNSVFTMEYCGDGMYCIKQKVTGRNLDIETAGSSSNTGLWNGNEDGTPNGRWQKWIIKKLDFYTYNIISLYDGRYLTADIDDLYAKDGDNVSVRPFNGSEGQKWYFIAAELKDQPESSSTNENESQDTEVGPGGTNVLPNDTEGVPAEAPTAECNEGQADNNNPEVFLVGDTTYKRNGVKPEIRVVVNGNELVNGIDYKITYSNNKKAGKTAKYSIRFKGKYKSIRRYTGTFMVQRASLDDALVVASDRIYRKPGTYLSVPCVMVNGRVVPKGEYSVNYYDESGNSIKKNQKTRLDNDEQKTMYVEVCAKNMGNYSGTAIGHYKIINTRK